MATPNLNLETIDLTDNMQTSLLEKMNGNFAKIDSAYDTLKNALLQKTGKNTLAEAIAYIDNLVNAQDATITSDKVFNGYTGYKGTEKVVGTALATESTGSDMEVLDGFKLYDSSGALITGTMANKSGTIQTVSGTLSGDYYQMEIPENGYYTTESKLQRTKSSVITDLNITPSDLGITPMPTINITCNSSYISGYGAGINKDGVLVIWAMSNSTAYEHINFTATSIGAGTTAGANGWGITSFDTSDPAGVPYACTVLELGSYSTINITLEEGTLNTSYDYVQLKVRLTAS